jgi:Domain of unknown function (DUF4253)
MDALVESLTHWKINCADLDVLAPSDRGDVMYFTAPGGKPAVELWGELRELIGVTKHWPVLLGSVDEIEHHREMIDLNDGPVSETIKYALTIDAPNWLDRRQSDRLEQFEELNEAEDSTQFMNPLGEWPDELPQALSLMTPYDITTRKPHERVAIALAPTIWPWEVPALLRLGSWNECPEAAAHCAVQKYWYEKYGAEIVAATPDVIEMTVPRPPETREDALELARQQYIYCADIVDQGTETLSNLAATLLHGKYWFFWWD